jgi:hypothetical protein
MNTEKLTPIEQALISASELPPQEAQKVLMMICENGLRPGMKQEKDNDADD